MSERIGELATAAVEWYFDMVCDHPWILLGAIAVIVGVLAVIFGE